jgi:hypothetical protein
MEPFVAVYYPSSVPYTLMPLIRHPDPALSIGFEGDSLAVQISSCTSVPQQKLPFRIARPNVYVIFILSLECSIPPDIFSPSYSYLTSHRETLQEDMYGRQSPSQSVQMLLQLTSSQNHCHTAAQRHASSPIIFPTPSLPRFPSPLTQLRALVLMQP